MSNLKGKNVVVTGGNRGIGEAIAFAFANEGANIIITYHSDQNLAEKVVNKLLSLGVKAHSIQFNAKESGREAFAEQCYEYGDIDILVNNAGIGTRNSFLMLAEKEIRDVIEVNFMAPLFLMQEFAKRMVVNQRKIANLKEPLNDYCIINITSISQMMIYQGLSHYEASKAALNQLSKSVSIDLAKYHIRVNSVAPGIVPTEINRLVREQNKPIWDKRISSIPLNRAGDPAEVASTVLFVAKNRWMTGSTLVVDGGMSNNWGGSDISHNVFADA